MIDTSLQQSEPVALPHRSPGRVARSVAGYSLLMALMIMLAFPVFVPAVVLYCGIRYGTRSAAVGPSSSMARRIFLSKLSAPCRSFWPVSQVLNALPRA